MTQYMTIKEAVDTLDVTQARVYSLIAESKLRKKPDCRPIQVRATDRTGYTQTESDAPPAPDGATGWHSVTVTAR